MKNKKLLTGLLSATFLSTMAIAADEYNSPVIMMKHANPVEHTSTSSGDDKFKVEGSVDANRGLASEEEKKEVVDREPTSEVVKPAPQLWKHIDKN